MRPAALLLILVTLASCQRGQRKVVGVVPKGANHIFWQTVHAGAIKAGQEYGFEVEWNAPAREVDSSRQIEIVESMVNRRLAGIVLAPVDRRALVSAVDRAWREKVPVSIFDSAIDTKNRVSYVATNNVEGGRMAARRLAESIGGRGKVAIIGFMPGSASTMEREDGFQDEMKQKFPGIQVVALQFGMADRAKAMAATENVLAAHPDLAGLFADNESSSSGTVQALKSRNAKQVKLVAFDASEQLIADCRAGWIDALVLQNPFRMGYESARAIGEVLAGRTPAAEVDSGATLVTREKVDAPEMRDILAPDISKYLRPSGH